MREEMEDQYIINAIIAVLEKHLHHDIAINGREDENAELESVVLECKKCNIPLFSGKI